VKPSERRRIGIGIVAAAVVIGVLSAVRAWQGASELWVTVVTMVSVVAWGAWVLWSRYRGDDQDDSSSDE
jgi:ABC-type nickel/cobalt efflux system permease component RcnA